MTDNPLVAAPIDTATPFSGAGLLDSGTQLAAAIDSGSWVEGGVAALGVALDTAATVMDPLGSLIGAGLGWLIDHFEPLKGWFNDLTGDAGEVAAFAQTWANIQAQLQASGDELTRVLADVDDLHGEAMDAYRRFQQDAAGHITGAASWAGAMSTGLSIASTIVQVVHDLVRDVISQLVGSAISWAAEAVFSLGLATPWIVSQVTTRVSSLAATVGSKVTTLIRSVKSLSKLLDELKVLLSQADELFASVLRGGPPSAPRTPGTDVAVPHDAPGLPASIGHPLSDDELQLMIDNGYHSSVFGDQIAPLYDRSGATLGGPNSDVWAMPTEDAAQIGSVAQAARETGMAPTVQNAHLNGGDVYAVHFPVDPAVLRRPTLADSGGWPHFYEDPTNLGSTYGHTAVNTGNGSYLLNQTRETLVPGGNAVPGGAVLTHLEDGSWVVVRRY
ncbi:hypothetical protein ACFM35_14485 [Microbacterium sp. P01]|uniref:hypothetical protein n=1 Tax=Microbacterium sp. P01 TaxID=3366261 RepID=UPI00366B50E0